MPNNSTDVLVKDTSLMAIANAIRSKNGSNDTYTPVQMATAISNIPTGGQLQTKTITPTISQQSVLPDTGYDGFSSVTVNAVTSDIDSDIQATNIKSGVNILGVEGSVVELKGETKTITPSTSQQTITPSSGKNGITQATVSAVTSSIDNNIIAENIKKDVSILGVTGTYEGSGGIINGIIEQYKVAAGESVNAGDFVKFISDYTIGNDVKISDSIYSGANICAVQLDTNKIFVAYNYNAALTAANTHIEGAVITINGTTFSVGTTRTITSSNYTGATISATKIDTDKVFVAYNSQALPTNTGSRLYAIVCTISGTTITVGSQAIISTATYSGAYISAVQLETNKVFIAYGSGGLNSDTANKLYGIVCTISETTITKGTETNISSENYSGANISATLIDTNKVFIAHNGYASGANTASGSRLYALVCTISGTTITKGTDTNISDNFTYSGAVLKTVKIDTNKTFIAYKAVGASSSQYARLFGKVCTVNGTTITAGEHKQISDLNYSGIVISLVQLEKDKICAVYSADNTITNSGVNIYSVICSIDEYVIEKKEEKRIAAQNYSGAMISTALADSNKIFIAHNSDGAINNSSSRIYGIVCKLDDTAIKKVTYESSLNGIAKVNGASNETIDVYVPEKTKGNFNLADLGLLGDDGQYFTKTFSNTDTFNVVYTKQYDGSVAQLRIKLPQGLVATRGGTNMPNNSVVAATSAATAGSSGTNWEIIVTASDTIHYNPVNIVIHAQAKIAN